MGLEATVHPQGKPSQELKARTWRHGLKENLRINIVYWVVFPGLLCKLSSVAQNHLPKDAPAYSALGPSISMRNQNSSSTHIPQTEWSRQILNKVSFPQVCLSSHQADKNCAVHNNSKQNIRKVAFKNRNQSTEI